MYILYLMYNVLKLGVADDQSIKGTSAKVAERIMNILHEIAQQRAFLHDYTYETLFVSHF